MVGSELGDLEEILVRVVADPSAYGHRIVEQLMERLGTPSERPPVTVDVSGGGDDLRDMIIDHNILLAAALGACECWGTDPGCAFCGGAGEPAWRVPDRALYDQYVAPAVARRDRQTLTTVMEGPADAHLGGHDGQ